jgi:hypothetical protein
VSSTPLTLQNRFLNMHRTVLLSRIGTASAFLRSVFGKVAIPAAVARRCHDALTAEHPDAAAVPAEL